MIRLCLDAQILARGDLHTKFAEAFALPSWYGRNLDALYDCLADYPEDAEITVKENALLGTLGDAYVARLLRVLSDLTRENANIQLIRE